MACAPPPCGRSTNSVVLRPASAPLTTLYMCAMSLLFNQFKCILRMHSGGFVLRFNVFLSLELEPILMCWLSCGARVGFFVGSTSRGCRRTYMYIQTRGLNNQSPDWSDQSGDWSYDQSGDWLNRVFSVRVYSLVLRVFRLVKNGEKPLKLFVWV